MSDTECTQRMTATAPSIAWETSSAYRRCASALALLSLACTTLPRPPALAMAERQESNSALQRAAQLAPQSFAHAKLLREEAESALSEGDTVRANIIAEHAIAAQQHTLVQARLVNAERRIRSAKAQLDKVNEQTASLAGQQQLLEAEAKSLELRVRVVRDAEPLEPLGPASPGRERARRKAAQSTLEEARLSCLAAQMLDPDSTREVVPELDRADASDPDLETAMKLRFACLEALTTARRPTTAQNPARDLGDQLLKELSTATPDAAPTRDDRGVVVRVEEAITGGTLSDAARSRLQSFAKVIQQHEGMKALVVLHDGSNPMTPDVAKQAHSILEDYCKSLGMAAKVHVAGQRLPNHAALVVGTPPQGPWLELVFVVP